MTTDPAVYRLATGDDLVVRVLEPPLGEYAERIEYWWSDVREAMVWGDLAATSVDHFVVGEIDGEYVGSMTYGVPRTTRDLAILGMVWTRPDQRRKGISRHLLAHTLVDFRAGGGIAMYLCTTNPHAYALYHQAGFRSLVGDGLRYVTPGNENFDTTFFVGAGPASIRPAEWGDIARVSALYNRPEPDWLIKDYPRRVFADRRFEGNFVRIWKPVNDRRGVALVLENPHQRVIGIASAIEVDSQAEQHALTLDVFAAPAYLEQVPALLEATITAADDQGNAEVVQCWVADADATKVDLLRAAGLTEEARLRDRLAVGDSRSDLLLYSRHLGRRRPPARASGDYYGGRPAFHDASPAADPP